MLTALFYKTMLGATIPCTCSFLFAPVIIKGNC